MTQQAEQLVKAVYEDAITEQEAIEFLVAVKRGDKEAIERLMEEHKEKA